MSVGRIIATIIDVDDLEKGEAFWSEVAGLEVMPSAWPGRYSYLAGPEGAPWLTLQLVDSRKPEPPNRVHVDIVPDEGIDAAVARIIELGGSIKKEPAILPRPETADILPLADWAVMQDPFGNEFCLVVRLSDEQRNRVVEAFQGGATAHRELRVAAGVTS